MPEIQLDEFESVTVGGQRLDPGPYTFVIHETPEVKDLDPAFAVSDQKAYLEVKMKVIEGPEQENPNPATGSKDPAGMVHTQRFYLNAKFSIKALLIATGLLARDDTESPMAKGKFNTDMLYNTKFKGIVKSEMYNGREYRNVEPVI